MSEPARTYIKDDISVEWRPELCIHCSNCTNGLPQVFSLFNRPWIDVTKATKEQIVDQVNKCPSKAISIKET